MTRVTLAEKLSVRCPKCGALAGDFCRRMFGHGSDASDCVADRPHRERREEFLSRPPCYSPTGTP